MSDLEPVTREEYFLKKAGEGGGGDVTIEQLNVSENGTYTEEGKAYSPVVVNVPSAVLGSLSVTENGTYTPPSGVDGYNEVSVDVPLPQNALLLKDIPSTPTAIATFSDGAEMVMSSLTVGVDAWQEGSGDPSPSNVRPIHGWDEVDVNVSGTNQWDEEWEQGYYDANGNKNNFQNAIRSKNHIPCLPNTTYYIHNGTDSNGRIQFYDASKNWIGTSTGIMNNTVTTPNNCYYINISTGTTYGGTYNNDISINYPSTDTSYHAYNGQTYTINLNGTRYGGRLEIVNGVARFVATKGYIASYNGETLPSDWISDRDVYSEGATPTIGAEVVYTLATPTIIPLGNYPISTLVGDNNVFADSGEILEGEYLGGVS